VIISVFKSSSFTKKDIGSSSSIYIKIFR